MLSDFRRFSCLMIRFSLLVSLIFVVATSARSQPNIILIMADDFGYECVTANGGESYQTPHLDRLAAGGMRFEHGHSAPLCTPTRVQLMTGKYNVRNYLNFGTLMRTETTFAHLLKQAGYATGICGKWQLGKEPDSAQHFGFDESLLWQQTRRPPRYANPGLELNGIEKEYPEGSYGPTLINDFALDFITRNKGRPFFLYYPMILTHDPFQPTPDSPEWDPTTKSENAQRNVKHFADMTAYMDKMIGRVDAKLAELGIRENTLLIFLGDNGSPGSITSRFKGTDLKGGKGSTAPRGHHVPFIVSWPGVMKQGRVNGDLISCADVLPTLCEAAGAPLPQGLDGISFLPQLKGETGSPHAALYMWYSPRQKASMEVKELVFDQYHSLYRTGECYDLKSDPDEKSPLPAEHPARAKLQQVLDNYKDARPEELDRQFEAQMKSLPGAQKKSNRKKQSAG
jgi:arylsulfatase A